MKKLIFVVVIAALAAVNVNIGLNSNESYIDLSLTSIMALARGETDYCSICGYHVQSCNCSGGITCDHGSCRGTVCHYNSQNPACWCRANGNPNSFCI